MKRDFLVKFSILCAILCAYYASANAQVSLISSGGANTSASYSTLKQAFDSINAGAHKGVISIIINGNIVETSCAKLNSSGVGSALYTTVNISPNGGPWTVQGDVSTSLIMLDGADGVTIDGGSSRNLIIKNNSTSYPSAAIWLRSSYFNSSLNNTITNCQIQTGNLGSSWSTDYTYGIIASGGISIGLNSGYNFDNLTISNNAISKATIGICVYSALSGASDNVIIKNNVLGSDDASSYISKYGVYLYYANSAIVSGNEIFNIIPSVSMDMIAGIFLSDCNNGVMKQNQIHSIITSGIGSAGIFSTGGSKNTLIANNIIYDINSSCYGIDKLSTTPYNPSGIFIGGGKGYKIYHNSINLYGDLGDSWLNAPASAALLIGDTSVVDNDIRSNIFANAMTPNANAPTNSFRYAIVYPKESLNTTINYNDYYVADPTSFLGFNVSTQLKYQFLPEWQAFTLQDSASISADPLFLANNILALSLGSPAGSAGKYIPIAPVDYIGNARSTTNPSMGAYEGTNDVIPPTFSFVKIPNNPSTASNTATDINIDDASGINSTTALPRIYYKKTTQANDSANWKWSVAVGTASPFSFAINYSDLGGVTRGDEIEYFFVAQDNSPLNNVGFSAGVPNAKASSVALTASAFPINGTLGKFIVSKLLSGVKTVGVGGDFASLTGDNNGAFTAINNGCLTGNLTLKVISNLNESGKVTLNSILRSGGDWNLKIAPDTSKERIISGSVYSGSLINFSSVRNATIDGSYNGAGRYLTFKNLATSLNTYTATIAISASSTLGCSKITIANSQISGAINTDNCYGVYVGDNQISNSPQSIIGNDTITISNNYISKAYYGICFVGSSSHRNAQESITKNIIGSTIVSDYIGYFGIYMQNSVSSTISQNEVYNIKTSSGGQAGIALESSCDSVLIEKNLIHGLYNTSSWGSSVYGMYFFGNHSNIEISNNVIYDINNMSSGNYSGSMPIGMIFVEGVSYKVYNNSVNLFGSYFSGATSTKQASADVYFTEWGGGLPAAIDLRNNSFTNTMSSTISNDSYIYGMSDVPVWANYTFDYNNYYVANSGVYANTSLNVIALFSDWQLATSQDVHSDTLNPQYASNTVLTPLSASPLLIKGDASLGISSDILGNTRSTVTPSIGAYEISVDIAGPEISYTKLTNDFSTIGRTLSPVKITDAQSSVDTSANKPRLYYKKTSQANDSLGWQYVIATGTAPDFSFAIDYSEIGGASIGDEIQYFVIAMDNSANANVSFENGVVTSLAPLTTNLHATNYPVVGAINSYFISGQLSGIKTVGVGGDFINFTGDSLGAFEAINKSVVVGDLKLKVISDIHEPCINSLKTLTKNGGAWTLAIVPDSITERRIYGEKNNGAIINTVGVDGLTIDGSIIGGGRFLKFENTASVSNISAGMRISEGSSNITIANCTIIGGDTLSNMSAGIIIDGDKLGSSKSANNNNISIVSNIIAKSYCGVAVYGNATYPNNNLIIKYNTIGSNNASERIGHTGISLSGAPSAIISGNEIFNILASNNSTPIGIRVIDNCDNVVLEKNYIHKLYYTSYGGYGADGIQVSGSNNITIHANAISDINGDSWETADGGDCVWGIKIENGVGHKLIYNSVNLFGDYYNYPHDGQVSGALAIFGTSTDSLTILNNALINTKSSTIDTSNFAILVSPGYSGALLNWAHCKINFNDYYTNSTYSFGDTGAIGAMSGAITIADWQAITLQDSNSINEDPLFVDNSLLTISSTSSLIGKALALTAYPSDIKSIARSATLPTIGAFETSLDLTSPTIEITKLDPTPSLLSRSLLGVLIQDAGSGLNVTTYLPRLYYKKKSQANNINSWKYSTATGVAPYFDFAIDYTQIGGVVAGDEIQYFVVAQDLATVPNTAISSGISSNNLTGVSLNALNFPIGGAIDSYMIQYLASGVKTVGVGGDFTSLTGETSSAFGYLDNSVLVGDVVFKVVSDLTESGYYNLRNIPCDTGSHNISIIPANAINKKINGFVQNSALLRINGTQNLTIDGSYNGSGKYLSFINTDTNNTQTANFLINNSCKNLNIKNLNIKGQDFEKYYNQSSYAIYLIPGDSALSSEVVNIENNTFTRNFYGIIGFNANRLTIKNNIMGSNDPSEFINDQQIFLKSSPASIISGNEIFNMYNDNTTSAGINLAYDCGGSKIEKNYIHSLYYIGSNGAGMYGIFVNEDLNDSVEISNNAIAKIYSDGSENSSNSIDYNAYGIFVKGGGYDQIYNNSVNLFGDLYPSAYGSSASAICFGATVSSASLENNIFITTCNMDTSNFANAKSYAIWASDLANFSDINFNDYYANGSSAFFGYEPTNGVVADIASWRLFTMQDANSISTAPNFYTSLILKPLIGSSVLSAGTPISSVSTDIINDARSLTTPSIGAYEHGLDLTPPTVVTDTVSSISYFSAIGGGNVTKVGGTPVSERGFIWSLSSAPSQSNKLGAMEFGAGAGAFSGSMTGLNSATTYYVVSYAVNLGGTSYGSIVSFTTLVEGFTVSGVVSYAQYAEDSTNAKILLTKSTFKAMPKAPWVKLVNISTGATLDSITADATTGAFSFSRVPNGVYRLALDTSMTWTSAKAYQLSLVDYKYIKEYTVKLVGFDSLQMRAANIDSSGSGVSRASLTLSDAGCITKRVIGVIDPIWKMCNYNYAIETAPSDATTHTPAVMNLNMTIIVSGADKTGIKVRGLSTGDINGL